MDFCHRRTPHKDDYIYIICCLYFILNSHRVVLLLLPHFLPHAVEPSHLAILAFIQFMELATLVIKLAANLMKLFHFDNYRKMQGYSHWDQPCIEDWSLIHESISMVLPQYHMQCMTICNFIAPWTLEGTNKANSSTISLPHFREP